MTESLLRIFQRDLKALKREIELYQREENLWVVPAGISNSAGNLTLHLIGNLNHFIGAMLGNTGYLRERDKEFSLRNVSRYQIIDSIDLTIKMLAEVLPTISPETLKTEFPYRLNEQVWETEAFLIHLVGHLNYHLGQVNYHRRLLDK